MRVGDKWNGGIIVEIVSRGLGIIRVQYPMFTVIESVSVERN